MRNKQKTHNINNKKQVIDFNAFIQKQMQPNDKKLVKIIFKNTIYLPHLCNIIVQILVIF